VKIRLGWNLRSWPTMMSWEDKCIGQGHQVGANWTTSAEEP
jgi:hypothetical protein